MPAMHAEFRRYLVNDPENADVILINCEGVLEKEAGDIITSFKGSKRILCVGPSTAGIARLNGIDHWCPYGT
jgi:hypothetical protein